VLRNHKPFGLELANRLSNGHPSHTIMLDELRLGRHTSTWFQVATLDRSAQLVRDLSERRSVSQPIDRAEFMHGSPPVL